MSSDHSTTQTAGTGIATFSAADIKHRMAEREAANGVHRTRISTSESRVAAYVIKTDENLMIARHTRALLGS